MSSRASRQSYGSRLLKGYGARELNFVGRISNKEQREREKKGEKRNKKQKK